MKYILFGSAGRLGRLAIEVLKKNKLNFILFLEMVILQIGLKIANLCKESTTIPFKYCLIDASIDYS